MLSMRDGMRDPSLVLLSCANTASALKALTAVTGASSRAVQSAITTINWADLEIDDQPVRALPRLAAQRLGRNLSGFTEVRYFHGTRTSDPNTFRQRGLLPLGARLEDIWHELRDIGSGVLSPDQFAALRAEMESGRGGDGGWQYRLKTSALMHHGPFGEYVREHFLRPGDLSNHDYLRTPELIDDIALAAHDLFGVDLLDEYTAATKPYIVAFDMPVDDDADAVEAACWYIWAAARCDVSRNACGGFDGEGVAVPASAIRAVEMTPTLREQRDAAEDKPRAPEDA